MRWRLWPILLLVSPVLGACSSAVVPLKKPTNFTYSDADASYIVGVEIPANVPSHDGGPIHWFNIFKGLPNGLTLNSTTGVITGTPTAPQPRTSYVVWGNNADESESVTIAITIVNP